MRNTWNVFTGTASHPNPNPYAGPTPGAPGPPPGPAPGPAWGARPFGSPAPAPLFPLLGPSLSPPPAPWTPVSNAPTPIIGCNWHMHRVDPRDLNAHMIRDVQHGMNVLMPWDYPCAAAGSTRNHSVRFRAQFTPRNKYLHSISVEQLGMD